MGLFVNEQADEGVAAAEGGVVHVHEEGDEVSESIHLVAHCLVVFVKLEAAWVNHDGIDLIEGGLVGIIRGAGTEVLDDFLGDRHGHLFLLECAG